MIYHSQMIEVRQSDRFKKWLRRLKDRDARARIVDRLARVALGHVGDSKSLGGGLYELRLFCGPGYRLYFAKRGTRVILLLAGGDKSSQVRDISLSREILKGWEP